MMDIIVMGAGGFAREVKWLIQQINAATPSYRFLGFVVSDMQAVGDRDSKAEILGDYAWFDTHPQPLAVALGIGTPKYRLAVAQAVQERAPQATFPSLVHPGVPYDAQSCRLHRGTLVCAGCVLTVNVTMHEFSMLNLCCTVGHETVIGPGCVMNPTVNLSGGVTLGSGVLIGTGAQVLQYVTVGENATIGAGAVAVKDVPAHTTVVGIPAKPLAPRA